MHTLFNLFYIQHVFIKNQKKGRLFFVNLQKTRNTINVS